MKIIRLGMRSVELCLIVLGVMLILTRIYSLNIYVVLSGSMEPTIKTGSVVLVDTKNKDYVIGDIITYEIDDQRVTHRIVEIDNGVCKTKGDANAVPDSVLVKYSQILGEVRYVIPVLGYVISYLKSEKMIFLIMIILFLSNLFDVLSESDSIKNKNEEDSAVQK